MASIIPLAVTQAWLDCARATGFNFGADTALVAVQHMLRQTVDLCGTAGAMGLPLKNIFALGKVYSNSAPVIRILRTLGVTVINTTVPAPGEFHSYFQRDINRLWNIAAEALSQRSIKRVIVLDDAGACIANVPADVLRQYSVCAVEQTSSGIFLFADEPPPFPVISWARTAVKLEIGGPIFAHTFVQKLHRQFLHGRSLHGEQAGVIGLGSIGRGVVELVSRQGGEVWFYDPNPDPYIPASLQTRIRRVDSLEELMLRCDYVLGCSGRNPFKGKWPLAHKPGLKLLSASGGDQEFGPIINDLKSKPDFRVAADTWDITSQDGPSGPIRVAYLGYPYQFVSRGPDAAPAQIVQLETGGLLAALIQARLHLNLNEHGPAESSGIHRVSPLAQRFVYDRWLRTMKELGINLTDVFGHDRETLNAAQHDAWFTTRTEPRPGHDYTPVKSVEQMMAQITCSAEAVTGPTAD